MKYKLRKLKLPSIRTNQFSFFDISDASVDPESYWKNGAQSYGKSMFFLGLFPVGLRRKGFQGRGFNLYFWFTYSFFVLKSAFFSLIYPADER